jgi:hypothetical protein
MKIVLTYDTAEKSVAVAVDGRAVENFRSLQVSPSWEDDGDFSCQVVSGSYDEENRVGTMQVMTASAKKTETRDATDAERAVLRRPPSDTPAKSLARAVLKKAPPAAPK